jgi:hypothetical protein
MTGRGRSGGIRCARRLSGDELGIFQGVEMVADYSYRQHVFEKGTVLRLADASLFTQVA